MSRTILSLMLGVLFFAVSIQAQSDASRFQKQHYTKFNKKNLKGTQEMLTKALESGNPSMASSAIQTLRELELVFPEESFESMLKPLIKIVKDEKSESTVRILALFALENLHSNDGDAAIIEVGKSTSDKTIQKICIAMSVEDLTNNEMGAN
jgi:hypothetical protein